MSSTLLPLHAVDAAVAPDAVEAADGLKGVAGNGHGTLAVVAVHVEGDAVPALVEGGVEDYDVAALKTPVAGQASDRHALAAGGGVEVEDAAAELELVDISVVARLKRGGHRLRGGVERVEHHHQHEVAQDEGGG